MKPAFEIPADGYRRTFAAEIDVITENELFVRGVMKDHRYTLEHTWTLRTPDYEVVEASARQLAGAAEHFYPKLCMRYQSINGVRIGRGFSRRIMTALGDLPGAYEHLLLAIEMARAGQQVYQFPPEFERQFAPHNDSPAGAAHIAWQKDRAYMTDLMNSCYTYRDESDELFRARDVRCGFDPSLTHPQPGTSQAFWRNKEVTLHPGKTPLSYQCESAMEDSVHDIRVSFALSEDGTISAAQSRGLRLPYHGICEDPHQRTSGLSGLRVTSDYIKQFAEHVGGRSGCTHLFDLSMDILRLFRFGA